MTTLRNLFLGALALCALGFLLTPRVNAQDKKPEPKAEKKTEAADALTASAPMRYEGLIFVDVMVNGKGPYNFLFDSGASMTMLSDRLCTELDIKKSDEPMPVGGVGTQDVRAAIATTITMAGFTRNDCACGVTNFDHISGELGKHMMGIVGQNMIKFMKRIELDFAASTITVTRYADGEGPNPDEDMQENAIRGMARGEGMPGMPGIPGLPGRRQPPKKEPKKEGEKPKGEGEKEEGFSVGPAGSVQWFGDDKKTATSAKPADALSFKYRHMELDMGLGKMELAALWFINVEINGVTREMFFDTGASTLCVLNLSVAESMKLATSYSYGVKGLGEGTTSEGLLESIKLDTLTILEPTCSVMDLSAALSQMEMVKQIADMLPKRMRPAGLDCAGIIGLPIATRYKKMTVDGVEKLITFTPYGKDEANAIDPVEQETHQREAVLRTWHGKAAKAEFSGDSVKLDDWAKLGLKQGGMQVTTVSGEAEKAGLKVGDIVTAIVGAGEPDEKGVQGDMPVRGAASLVIWACLQDIGSKHKFKVKRGSEELVVEVKLVDYGWKGEVPEKYRRK